MIESAAGDPGAVLPRSKALEVEGDWVDGGDAGMGEIDMRGLGDGRPNDSEFESESGSEGELEVVDS